MMQRKSPRSRTAKRGAHVKTQVRLMLDDEIAMGPGKADLLAAIDTTGSISAAGKQLGMSYRRAWLLVDTMNRCFREPLVTTAKGGAAGGGTLLSEHGRAVLQRYRELERQLSGITDIAFADLAPLLRRKPAPPPG